jgi:hypothetical protein
MKQIINQLFCNIVLDNFIVIHILIFNLFFFILCEYSFPKNNIYIYVPPNL